MQVLFKVHGRLLWMLHATGVPAVSASSSALLGVENERRVGSRRKSIDYLSLLRLGRRTSPTRYSRTNNDAEISRNCKKIIVHLVARFRRLGRTQCAERMPPGSRQGVALGLRPLSWRCVRRAYSAALSVVELVAQCGDLVWAEVVDDLSKCLGGARGSK